MRSMKHARIQDHFAELTDPRRREVIYPLINVVVIAVCAVLCGADDFVAIAEFGKIRRPAAPPRVAVKAAAQQARFGANQPPKPTRQFVQVWPRCFAARPSSSSLGVACAIPPARTPTPHRVHR